MARFTRIAAMVISTGLLVAGCMQQPNMPAAGAAGWRGSQPNTDDTVRFVVIADRTGGHVPGEWESAISEINLLQPDLVLSVGDLIEGYSDNPQELAQQWQEFERIASRLKAPFFYCPGNHDVEGSNAGSPTVARDLYLRKHSVQGNSYYSFDFKNAHFVVLDSPWIPKDEIFADEQFAWLRQDMTKAANAEHIFVFYHHPMWEDAEHWPTLASILPKGRTTIFNGHTHKLAYHMADGFPTFVMPSTGAQVGDKTDPTATRMFAYVALNGTKPTISFVSTGTIKSQAYPQALTQIKDVMSGAAGEMPADGGSFALSYSNPSDKPISVQYQIASPDWTIEPASGKADLPAGGATQIEITAKPSKPQARSPMIAETFTVAGGESISRERPLAVYRTADLGKLASITVDGKSDEWTNVSPMQMSEAGFVFQNPAAWKGAADSSCSVRVATSGDNLAMIIEAKDDQIVLDEQAKFWEQDAVEIFWDVRPLGQAGKTAGSGQIALMPVDGTLSKMIWIPAGKQAPSVPESVQSFTRRVEGGYVVELVIPFSELGLSGGTLSEDLIRICVTQDDLDGGESGAVLKRLSLTGTGDFWRNSAGFARFHAK